MSEPRDVLATRSNPDYDSGDKLVAAVIVTDAMTVDDLVDVEVDTGEGRERHTQCPWPSRVDDDGDTMYPVIGDRCLLTFDDDEGDPWIIGWWPYG